MGLGFTCHHIMGKPWKMAKVKCEQLSSGAPIVMTFEIKEDDLASLKVLRFDDYTEEWAKFILLNRNNPDIKPVHDYDVVIGPIANDRVGVQLWKYENQMIDLPTLVSNLRFMKGITFQYFFGTENAINMLKKL